MVKKLDVSYLDGLLLGDDGLLRVLPAAELAKIPLDHMRFWCHVRAVYTIPSVELISWLKNRIGERKAVEVGSGNGAVGRALGVPITDSRMQERPDVKLYYVASGQPTIAYPDDVECMNANLAVRRYKPQVVVGCWITHLYDPDDHDRGGNMYGVDEQSLVSKVETYIHVGATTSHSKKRILSLPHEELRPNWLFGRGEPRNRVIYVWGS